MTGVGIAFENYKDFISKKLLKISKLNLSEIEKVKLSYYFLEIFDDFQKMEKEKWCDYFFKNFLHKIFYDIEIGKLAIRNLSSNNVNLWEWLNDKEFNIFGKWLKNANEFCKETSADISIFLDKYRNALSLYGKKFQYTYHIKTTNVLYLIMFGKREKIFEETIKIFKEIYNLPGNYLEKRSDFTNGICRSYIKDFENEELNELKKMEKIFDIESLDILGASLHNIYKQLTTYTQDLSEYPLSISFLIYNKMKTDRPGYQWFLLPHQRFFLKNLIENKINTSSINTSSINISDLNNLDKFIFVGSEDADWKECSGYCWQTHKKKELIYRFENDIKNSPDEINGNKYRCYFYGKQINQEEWVKSVEKIEKELWFRNHNMEGFPLEQCIVYQKVIFDSNEYSIQIVIVVFEQKFKADYLEIINKLYRSDELIRNSFKTIQLANDKNRKIKQFALKSAIASIISRNLSHQRGSHLLPGLTSRMDQFEDSIASTLAITEEENGKIN